MIGNYIILLSNIGTDCLFWLERFIQKKHLIDGSCRNQHWSCFKMCQTPIWSEHWWELLELSGDKVQLPIRVAFRDRLILGVPGLKYLLRAGFLLLWKDELAKRYWGWYCDRNMLWSPQHWIESSLTGVPCTQRLKSNLTHEHDDSGPLFCQFQPNDTKLQPNYSQLYPYDTLPWPAKAKCTAIAISSQNLAL